LTFFWGLWFPQSMDQLLCSLSLIKNRQSFKPKPAKKQGGLKRG
jgi:hypothetical protein